MASVVVGRPDNGSGELGQAGCDAATGLSQGNANVTDVCMQLAGRMASVLAGKPYSCSGSRIVGYLLVGLLLHEGALGVGLTGGLTQMLLFWERGWLVDCAGGTVY